MLDPRGEQIVPLPFPKHLLGETSVASIAQRLETKAINTFEVLARVCVAVYRDSTAYLIMQRIDALQYEFPEEFDAAAKDLVSQLLVEEPSERLGSDDLAKLKEHAFFAGMCLCPVLPPSFAVLLDKSQNFLQSPLFRTRCCLTVQFQTPSRTLFGEEA